MGKKVNGMVAKALVFVHFSLLCFAVLGEDIKAVAPVPQHHQGHTNRYPAPAPVHHHHHHPHVHPPSPAPTHHHHQPHAPIRAPVHPPAHAPVQPPSPPSHSYPPKQSPSGQPHPPPPVHPPTYRFPRSLVAVQGVVYCKASCKYAGVGTLWDAWPLPDASVKLQCNNTKKPLEAKATTDKNGYFFLKAPNTVTTYGAHKCKVSLVSSPNATCSNPSDLHGGVSGGALRPGKPFDAGNLHFVLFSVGPFAFEPKCPH